MRGTAVQPAALLSFSEGAGHGVSCSWVAVGLPGRLVTVGARTQLLSLGVIRAGRLGRVLRPGRVQPGLPGPGPGPGRPGLRVGHRIIPLLPRRGQLHLPPPAAIHSHSPDTRI